jgi:ATP-dependent Clp protease ATP-binding subunit ClpC
MGGLDLRQLSDDARRVVAHALAEAAAGGTGYLGVEHVFMGLCKTADPDVRAVLEGIGVDPTASRRALRREVAGQWGGPPVDPQGITPRAERILAAATTMGSSFGAAVRPIDLLAALLEDGRGPALDFLRRSSAGLAAAREQVRLVREGRRPRASGATARAGGVVHPPTPLLDGLGRDLTALARAGTLRPTIGREKEIRQLAQVLSHRIKANPLLVGDAGVGKTCIVEGLAVRAAQPGAPASIAGLRVIDLQPAALVEGTAHHGDLEARLRAIVAEARADDRLVLFLDEIHTLLYAGASSGGAANILKPALARGELRCIGATTTAEYHTHFETDAALARRFTVVQVEEPTRDEALAIVAGLAPLLAEHHGVVIGAEAIAAAVDLSVRHMSDRRLPDKAIDLLDHACAVHMLRTLSPVVRADEPPLIGRGAVAEALSSLRGVPVGELEEDARARVLRLGDELRRRVIGQDAAVDDIVRVVQAQLAGMNAPDRPAGVMLFLGPTGVGKTELARVLAASLFGSEARLVRLDMSEYMEPHTVARLLGSPPGYVGHEEPGQLTGALHAHPHSVVLLDEIEKAHPRVLDVFLQVFDEGRITDARGRRVDFRECIIIMTSNLGEWGPAGAPRRVAFRTDNSPAAAAEERLAAAREGALLAVRKFLRPELLARIDKTVCFSPLRAEDLRRIAEKLVREVQERAGARGCSLEVDDAVPDALAAQGRGSGHGAREVRKAVDSAVRDAVARALLAADPTSVPRLRVVVRPDGTVDVVRAEGGGA